MCQQTIERQSHSRQVEDRCRWCTLFTETLKPNHIHVSSSPSSRSPGFPSTKAQFGSLGVVSSCLDLLSSCLHPLHFGSVLWFYAQRCPSFSGELARTFSWEAFQSASAYRKLEWGQRPLFILNCPFFCKKWYSSFKDFMSFLCMLLSISFDKCHSQHFFWGRPLSILSCESWYCEFLELMVLWILRHPLAMHNWSV